MFSYHVMVIKSSTVVYRPLFLWGDAVCHTGLGCSVVASMCLFCCLPPFWWAAASKLQMVLLCCLLFSLCIMHQERLTWGKASLQESPLNTVLFKLCFLNALLTNVFCEQTFHILLRLNFWSHKGCMNTDIIVYKGNALVLWFGFKHIAKSCHLLSVLLSVSTCLPS